MHYSTLFVFFFNDTATTEIYTLSLHDALPIYGTRIVSLTLRTGTITVARRMRRARSVRFTVLITDIAGRRTTRQDRKSTRLNSSHANISYAVFCLKKKKKQNILQVHLDDEVQL